MKLPETKRFQWNYSALAFAVPTGLMLVFMFITSCEPFGDHCMLYSDMFHQYYPFFCAFREALRSGDSILYNWNVGMGMEYLGLISYYLASPLNLFSVLIPESWTLEYFSLLLPIKLGLASMFFAIMLKKLFDKDDLSIVLFGAFYGMCSWALGYNWNIMWMDSFALLPLVVLGTIQLIRDRKFILYTITLFLSIFSNYYIGLFVCIFVFLVFCCYQICRCKSVWRFLEDLLRIGVFTILAIGMTAILELPTLASLQDTQSSVNTFPDGFSVNIAQGEAIKEAQIAWSLYTSAKLAGDEGLVPLFLDAMKASFPVLLDAMGQVAGNMGAAITPTFMDGLPNLYCGVFPIALAGLFLLSADVKLRDKLCCIGLLLFFILSFIFRQLDYIWHGFHFTNQIPYRFSFLFSFVLLYMAYRAWTLKDTFKIWQIVLAGVLALGLVFLSEEHRSDVLYMIANLLLLGGYLAAMLYGNQDWVQEEDEQAEEIPEVIPVEGTALSEENPGLISEETETPSVIQICEEPMEETAEESIPETEPEAEPESKRRVFASFPSWETRRQQAALAIACIMASELILNLATFGSGFPVNEYDYPKNGDATASMIQVMKEREEGKDLFYRTEVTHAQTLNDGALNYYHGLTTFTSSANVQVTNFTQSLGFGAYKTWNRYLYEEASPVTNLFTGLKYLIERDKVVDGNSCFKALHSFQKVTLLENQYYLPLGFLAESKLADQPFRTDGSFAFQNTLFSTATGVNKKVWSIPARKEYSVSGDDNVAINSANPNSGYVNFTSAAGGGKLTYTYEISKEGYFCLDVNLYSQKNFTVWLNGDQVFAESISLEQMFGVGDVKPGDVVQVVVECKSDMTGAVTVQAGVLNMEVFQEGYEVLSASTWQLTDFSNAHIAGTIVCDRDGLLYTSIPQCGNKRTEGEYDEEGNWIEPVVESEGNWDVYVDGKKAEIILVGDCMIAVALEEGQHTVEFVYENPSFELGWKISLICAGIFGAITAACYLPPYIKKKTHK